MMLRPKYFGYSIILDVSYPYIHGSVEHIKKMNGIELEFRSSVLLVYLAAIRIFLMSSESSGLKLPTG